MSSDVYAVPDLSKKVRYTRKGGDGREEWAEREVCIYESADDVVNNRTNFQSQEGEPQTRNHPTVQKAGVVGAVMCAVLLAGIIILSIYTILQTSELKSHISQLQVQGYELNNSNEILSKNYSQLMDEVKKLKSEIKAMASNNSQLQRSYDILSKNHSQLMDEVKKLKSETKAMASNNSQLQRSSDILSKNHSQLMDEVKKLKSETKDKCCPDGWTTFGCSCYFKSTEWKTWSESRKDCQDRGADLVIINSKEEQEFVSKLGKYTEFWIGLEWTERGWKWWDGTSPTETFWGDGQQHYYNGYNVVRCNYHGKWTTAYFTSKGSWICEK